MRLTEGQIRRIVRGTLHESAATPAPINVDRIKPAFKALMQQARIQAERILSGDLADLEEKLSDPSLTEDEAGGLFDAEYNDILRTLEESPPASAQTADKIARSMMDSLTKRISGRSAAVDDDEEDFSAITGNTRLLTYLCEIILRDIISTKPYAGLATWLGYNDSTADYLLESLVHTVRHELENAVLDTAPTVMRALRTRSLLDGAEAGALIEDLAARLSSINLAGRDGTPMIILHLRSIAAESDIEAKAKTAQALLDRMPGGLDIDSQAEEGA